MSRGLGKIQVWLLEEVRSASCASSTIESLRWKYFETHGDCCDQADLPNSTSIKVTRAVETLSDRNLLTLTCRGLANFDECLLHYPQKTLSGKSRLIRNKLLPTLAEAVEVGEITPKYDRAENERFMLKSLSEEQRSSVSERWQKFEKELRGLYGCHGGSDKEVQWLLRLIVRGSELFADSSVSCRWALEEILREIGSMECIPADTHQRLSGFCESIFPDDESSEIELKSILHQIAYISRNGAYSLRNDVLRMLHQSHEDFIESFPGTEVGHGVGRLVFPFRTKYDKDIQQLFNQAVFRKFTFIDLK